MFLNDWISELTAQGQEFLANRHRGLLLDDSAGVARLSQIFKWYATQDFVGGGLITKFFRVGQNSQGAGTLHMDATTEASRVSTRLED